MGSLRRSRIAVVGAALLTLVVGVPSASAGLVEEVVDAGESAVSTTTSPLPGSLPPASGPAPAGTQAPQAPASQVPGGAPTLPSHSAPASAGGATEVGGSNADLPPVDETTGAATEGLDRVTGASAGAAEGTAGAAPDRVAAGAGRRGGGSVAPAEAAGPPREFARVWPAIALVRFREDLADLLARWGALLPVADAARLISWMLGTNERSEVLGRSTRSAPPDHEPASPKIGLISLDGGMGLLLTMVTSLLALVALLALARLVAGEEFFTSPRWRH